MRLKILIFISVLSLLFGCTKTIEFDKIIDNSKSFELKKDIWKAQKTSIYKREIRTKSKKWIEFNNWLNNNKVGWKSTPVSYLTEITITQDEFGLLFFSDDKGESVVIHYTDEQGEGRQYQKEIKKGELDFIIRDLIKITKISKYGSLFAQKRHHNEPIKHLDIDDFKTYYDLKKEIENTLCNDSIPQIEMWSENELKTFIPFDYCSFDYGCVRINQRDIIEITNNHFIEKGTIYDLDSIYHLMKRKYLKKELTKYNPKPEKVYFQIIYENDEKLLKLKELLKVITTNYDSLKIENSLKIRFGGFEIVELKDNDE